MPSIDRVAFTLFGIDVYWYAVLITLGMVLGVIVAIVLAKKRGFKSEDILDIIIWVLPMAIIGARLYYVIFAWDASWTFARIFSVRDGGLAIYGGVIAGAITALIVCRVKKYDFRTVLSIVDCLAVGLILGQAIGRWGNFINQEAFGNLITNPSLMFFPYGVQVAGSWYQATFFYESMWNLAIFVTLFILAWKKPKLTGLTTSLYFIGYGIGRAFIEGLRSDSLYFLKELLGETIRVSQVLSVILIIGGGVLLYFSAKYFFKPKAEIVGSYGDGKGIIENDDNSPEVILDSDENDDENDAEDKPKG